MKYRQRRLDFIEEKLLQMKQFVEYAKEENVSSVELKALNERLNNLSVQVRALDNENRRMEDEKILE